MMPSGKMGQIGQVGHVGQVMASSCNDDGEMSNFHVAGSKPNHKSKNGNETQTSFSLQLRMH